MVNISSAINQARALQERLFTETLTITHQTGTRFDEDLRRTIPTWADLYTGAGRAATLDPGAAEVINAETASTPLVAVTIPHDTPTLPRDARIQITASTTGSPLVGTTVWVTSEATLHGHTARRYLCRTVR